VGDRHWTLEAAREMLAEVRTRTERAVKGAEALLAELETLEPGDARRPGVESRVGELVARWAREMEALGVEVKGPWLVDFDTGGGYLCWRWPEEELAFFHGYEEGFAGRTRIQ
jgi:hypothetical protein